MDKMRSLKVKGAMFEVRGLWIIVIGRPSPRVTRKIYYCNYGGPGSQITDADWLRRIRESGLESELETEAILRADKPQPALDPLPSWCRECYTQIFLADDEWLLNVPPRLSEWADSVTQLDQAAADGDAITVSELLSAGKYTKSQLDEALLYGATEGGWDNTEVVRILQKAGATPEADWTQESLDSLKLAEEQDSSK